MMALTELLQFENPGMVALAIGVGVFALAFFVFSKFMENRATNFIVSFVLGLYSAYYIYDNEVLYNLEGNTLAFGMIVLVVVVLFLLLMGMFRKRKNAAVYARQGR